MNRFQTAVSTVALLVAGLSSAGCTPGGVGDPCIPEDEYGPQFPGYGAEEVNVEAMSFQCETRLCLVNHFQGRVTCPYGQVLTDANGNPLDPTVAPELPNGVKNGCYLPDLEGTPVLVEVKPQLMERRTKNAVYCSCRCDGPDKNARYCDCPSGYACTLLNEIKLEGGADQLLGSYCVRNGTAYTRGGTSTECNAGDSAKYCDDVEGYDKGKNPYYKKNQ